MIGLKPKDLGNKNYKKLAIVKMNREINCVKKFQIAYGLPVATKPTYIPIGRAFMRHDLLKEEVDELFAAIMKRDFVEIADAITDCLYILYGTAIEYGISDKLVECFAEVHRSNMSKLDADGKPIYREDGKVLKGELYSKPNLIPILFA